MKKRILALMLACFMIVSLLPMQVFAQETLKCPGTGNDHVLENCDATLVEKVEPTCISWGYTIYACDACGDHFVDEIVAKNDDHNTAYVEPVRPDCATETDGVVGGTYCVDCGLGRDEAFAVIEWAHEFDVVVGNCLEGTTKTCKVCGYVEYEARGQHCYVDENGEYIISSVIAPNGNTCGIATYECFYCNEPYEVEILHNLHYVPATEYTCTEDGNIAHYICTTCNTTYTVESVEGWWEWDWYIWDYVWMPGYLETLDALLAGEGTLEGLTKLVEVDPVVSAHHDHVPVEYFEGGCFEKAWTKYECVRCGDTYVVEYEVAHNHNVVLVYDPTCTTYGYTVYFCDLCGTTFKDDVVAPTGHNPYTYTVSLVYPTCTETGTFADVTVCLNCGEELGYVEYEVEALDHDWFLMYELAPNCATLGHQYYICTRCGEEKHEVLERNDDHFFGDDAPVEIKYPTCTEDGGEFWFCYWCNENVLVVTEEYKALGHVLYTHITETCCYSMTFTWCEYCDYEEYEYVEFEAEDVLIYDSVEEAEAAHSTYETYICEDQRNPFNSYSYSYSYVNCYEYSLKAPTCGNIGYVMYNCNCCENAFVAVLPETGAHVQAGFLQSVTFTTEYVYGIDFKGGLIEVNVDYSNGYAEAMFLDKDGNYLQPDSYSQNGNIVCFSFIDVEYVELRFFCYYGEVTVTPYLESTVFAAVDPTCDEAGMEEYWYCVECREMVGGEEIPAHGRYNVHAENKAPTCTEDGWIIGDYCPVCDEYTTFDEDGNRYVVTDLVVPALGHDIIVNFTVVQVEGWMTVIADERRLEHSEHAELFAYTHYVCANGCDIDFIMDYHPGVDHTWVLNEEESYAPTCTQPGANIYYCDCGAMDVEELPALGHDYTQDPEDGCCSRCDDQHDFVLIATMPATCSVGEYELYLCLNCGFEHAITTTLPNPNAHIWGATEQIFDENGHETGIFFHICTLCGEYEQWDAEHYVNFILDTEDTLFVPGSLITVTITLDANYADVWGFDVNVFFDAYMLDYVGYTASSGVFDYLIEAQHNYNVYTDEHFIGVAATATANGVVIEDVVVTLYFQAKTFGYTQFELYVQSVLELNGDPVAAYGDVEGINIYQIMDIDMDGDIDLEDLRLCYVIMTAAEDNYFILADADCDNDVDPDDLLAIYRYILSH